MKITRAQRIIILALVGLVSTFSALAQRSSDLDWTSDFSSERSDLVPTGRNPYFILEPGYVLTLADGDKQLVITVTNETRVVDGITTRIVEERESEGGHLSELSRNFFAISKRTNSVYYFGEEVDIYKNDKIAKHEGAWLSGVNGARFGLMMPGLPLIKGRYYQEITPGVAMDRGEVISLSETLKTPAGEFRNCLKTEDSSQIEPGKEFKFYAPGVGLVQEESLKLIKYGFDQIAKPS